MYLPNSSQIIFMQLIQFLRLLYSSIIYNFAHDIGRLTSTQFDKSLEYKNKLGNKIFVNNARYAGIVFGNLNPEFFKIKNKVFVKVHTVVISKKTRE